MDRPEYLAQGETARLFPVLSTTSKEGRTTSIVLACMDKVEEFGTELLDSLGQRMGKRSKLATFTEIVFKGEKADIRERPDGLIILKTGSREWRALVEAKIGNAEISGDQVERYRNLAKLHGLDCVITISNQFSTAPATHPLEDVRKSRSKIPVFHWSWMYVLTVADLLLSSGEIADVDQQILLTELTRFLTHESAGIKGFDRMPPEWSELNRLVSAGGRIPAKSVEAETVLKAWHQETRDLSLILSRQTETVVSEKLPRKHIRDLQARYKDELKALSDTNRLTAVLQVPNAAAPLEVIVDITRRTIDVGMTLRAPEDKKSSKARLNWLLRQIKIEPTDEIHIRMNWPGRSEATQFPLRELVEDPGICEQGKADLQVLSFHVCMARRLGGKFAQQINFIKELEEVVPEYYRTIGQNLAEWRRPAPKIRPDRDNAADVTPEAMADDIDGNPALDTD